MNFDQTIEYALADHGWDCRCPNCDRAKSCEVPVLTFAKERGLDLVDDIDASISHLISNLGHYCEKHELDFVKLVQRGISRWRGELEAPEELAPEFTARLTITRKKGPPIKG